MNAFAAIGRQTYHLIKGVLFGNRHAAIVTSIVLATAGSTVAYTVSRTTGFEAQRLLSAALPAMRFLSSAVITASATVLGLMLTLISVSRDSEHELGRAHYERVASVSEASAMTFVGGTVFLLVLTIPIEQADEIPAAYYRAIYASFMVANGLLAASLTAVVVLLYRATAALIRIPGDEPSSGEATAEAAPASTAEDAAADAAGAA